jgi:hypothetical protein
LDFKNDTFPSRSPRDLLELDASFEKICLFIFADGKNGDVVEKRHGTKWAYSTELQAIGNQGKLGRLPSHLTIQAITLFWEIAQKTDCDHNPNSLISSSL